MFLKRLLSVLGAAALSTALIAPAAIAQTTPKHGGTLVATWGGMEPQALFVPAGGGSSPAFTATKVFERLVKMERDLSFSPVLALSVTPSADFKTYTVKLRPDVKWHDGKPFTAEDVAFSAMEYWKPIAIGVAFKSLQAAKVVDPLTVELQFSDPMAEFALKARLADWALVIPKHVYAGSNIITNAANNQPVGTGPYKLKSWTRGSHVEFVKNEGYWDHNLPYLDRLIIRYWRDPASRAAALEAGELDIATFNPVPAPDLPRLTKTGKIVVDKHGYENSAWVSTIEFNTRNEVTGKRDVRRALMHAINKQFIANTVYYKLAKPADSVVVSGNAQFYTGDVDKYAFDPKLAGELLDKAGYPVKADGSRFTVTLVAAAWFEENARLGQYVKQALEDVKVKVNLVVADRPTALKRIYTDYDYDIALSNNAQAMELIPQVTRFYTSDSIIKGAAFRNATGYSNPEVDKTVDALAIEPDPAKRKVLAAEFQKMVTADAPILPLVEIDSVTVARSDVKNHSNAANYMNESWADIWLDR